MKRSTLLLAILGLILATAVWFVFFISPKRSKISDIDDEISATQSTADGLRGEIGRLKDIRDSELTYRRAIAEVESSIPATPELASFIEEVNLLAINTDVTVNSLTPSPPVTLVDGQLFQPLTITIDAQGQFFELLGFLYGLQDLERLVKIDNISLATVVDESGNQEMSLNLSGSIFTLATDLPAPSIEPPAPAEPAPTTTTTVPEETAAAVTGDGGDT
ncbi:MAG: type 4a pilus biogenesis protein PilO [Acidimicrobiia bacterium]|nr:type 4a pilus biogenesis protein PilO [Acidimicrobiia bacterium]